MAKRNVMHGEIPTYTIPDRKSHIILKLKNFRSYGDGEIRIPRDSVTLINGESGVGKTTIFEGFVFVMYNGVSNPERFDTKTCWAFLFIGDLIIYRQKDPKLLKVWRSNITTETTRAMEEYTNEDAQRVIDSTFGCLETFIGCSYLRQKEFSVFLGGSDAEKLGVIKDVAMRGSELDEIKNPIKEELNNLKTQHTAITAQLEMAISNVRDFDMKNPNITNYKIPENPVDVVKEVKEIRNTLERLDIEFKQALTKEIGRQTIEKQIAQITSKISGLKHQSNSINPQNVESRLAEIELKLKEFNNISFDVEKLAKSQMFKLWNEEKARIESKLSELDRDLDIMNSTIRKTFSEFPQYSKLTIPSSGVELKYPSKTEYIEKCEEAQKTINNELENLRSIQNEISTLLDQIKVSNIDDGKKYLDKLEEDLKLNMAKEESMRKDLDASRMANKMECPSCKTILIMGKDGKSLEKCGDRPSGIGAMLSVEKKETVSAAVTHDDISKIAVTISELTNNRDRAKAIMSACLEKQEKIKSSPHGNSSIKEILILVNKFVSNLKTYNDTVTGLSIHNTRKPEEVTEKQVDNTEKNKLEAERSNLNQQLNNHSLLLKLIEAEETNNVQFTKLLQEDSTVGYRSSNDIRKEQGELQGKVDRLMHISSTSDLLTQRAILEQTVKEKAAVAQSIERSYRASNILMTKAIEAERISLQTAMDEINTNLNSIVKKLFTRVPMTVELSATKQLKNGNTAQRFDLQVFFNNSDYGSARQLSGGEKDRLSLAITLAVSQKFGSPLLFLDETLSSLDTELKSEAVKLLKEYSQHKTIVCVSHEETEGLYNHVIRIKSRN